MRVLRSDRMGDEFADELRKKMAELPLPDLRLDEYRDDKDYEPTDKTEEGYLRDDSRGNRKSKKPPLTEKLLRQREKANDGKGYRNSPNSDTEGGITEKRLDKASTKTYPHRNPAAWERTKEKRPVNALDEEMGASGDQSKLDRYNKLSRRGPSSYLDEEPGSQMTNDNTKIKNAYNHRRKTMARTTRSFSETCSDYLSYRGVSREGAYNTMASKDRDDRFSAAKSLDEAMLGIMGAARDDGRCLNEDEQSQICAMKLKKCNLLKIASHEDVVAIHKGGRVIAGREELKIDQRIRRAINKALSDVSSKYWSGEIPLDLISSELGKHGVRMEEVMLTGEEGRDMIDLMDENGAPFESKLFMTWHKMPETGNWEIVAYLS